jgi:NAD(P)-dependent dehydrogenase (short-subunit alcohol dehydrogenase family)
MQRLKQVFNIDMMFIPMGRQGDGSELAAVVSFKCSADASYVTGQTINVDGGARLD